jgi:arylsulfatase A-like enzyme
MLLVGVALYLWKSGETKKLKSTRDDGPNIVLITLDTTRVDALGVYGGDNDTPVLDKLAQEGTMFTHAVSTAPITQPAHLSILSGNPPHMTGVVTNGTDIGDRAAMLPYALGAGGWVTAGFVSAYPLTQKFGFGQGWDHFDDQLRTELFGSNRERPAVHTIDRALAWLGRHKDQHFGVWIHLFDPHGPYEAPGRPIDGATDGEALALPDYWPDAHKAITDKDWFVEAYKAEVRTVDAAVGRVVDSLEKWGVLDETLIVVTADHGESLTEHGYLFDHGDHLYDVSLRVPLIFRWPGKVRGDAQLSCLVSNQDITPTLLGLLDIPDEHERQGRDLSAVLTGVQPCAGQSVLATTVSAKYADPPPIEHALRTHSHKRVQSSGGDVTCFDLEADPGEIATGTPCPPDMAPVMVQMLDGQAGPIAPQTDAETTEALKELGYIE